MFMTDRRKERKDIAVKDAMERHQREEMFGDGGGGGSGKTEAQSGPKKANSEAALKFLEKEKSENDGTTRKKKVSLSEMIERKRKTSKDEQRKSSKEEGRKTSKEERKLSTEQRKQSKEEKN